MKEIAKGAEAIIYLNKDKILKVRVPKSYRHIVIDKMLRKRRTRSEVKILQKLPVPCPKLISFDENESKIEMEYINGKKLRDVFDIKWAGIIGEYTAKIHNENIIHGDLTTSNIIVKDKKLYFIDFGLSYFSAKDEDKAVDLHLLKRALESKHYLVFEDAFKKVIKSYKKHSNKADEILKRLKIVETRGRNKKKR